MSKHPSLNMLDEPPPDDASEQVEALLRRIRPIMAGVHPTVLGTVLAALHTTLIAGFVPLDEEGSDNLPKLQAHLLELHAKTVLEMLPALQAELRSYTKGTAH